MARDVKAAGLTYLPYQSLRNIEWCLRRIRQNEVPGVCIEAGIALGGSGVVIASLASEREFHGYDVFGMIPPPGEKDGSTPHERYAAIASGDSAGIDGDRYYGYEPRLFEKVSGTFAEFGVPVDNRRIFLHKGLFEDTLDVGAMTVAFAHLDCDWYEPVKVCLERLYPALSPGGFLVCDDYYSYEGATRAIDEFVATCPDIRKLEPRTPSKWRTNLVLFRDVQ